MQARKAGKTPLPASLLRDAASEFNENVTILSSSLHLRFKPKQTLGPRPNVDSVLTQQCSSCSDAPHCSDAPKQVIAENRSGQKLVASSRPVPIMGFQ
jgi:hypothetical protein